MKITKTTLNYAKARNLDITVENFGEGDKVCFWEAGNDCEWMFSYSVEGDILTWNGNVYLADDVKEELPATIFNEKQLRQVIDFVSKEIAE
ncbi:hypothetical protein POP12_122 [Pectobacterium phage POP12]|nr:hypothetical protein POP12_122 [Pectobacterium phage POP12]